MITFSILITTKNRFEDIKITLQRISHLLYREDVECWVYDDGSTDGTADYILKNYPDIIFRRNEVSKGYMYNRNYLLTNCNGKYAISLDDDAHFLSVDSLEVITNHFNKHEKCGVIACRIFWGKEMPISLFTNEKVQRVNGFVGCGHIWNREVWNKLPNYPEWYEFYGEEDFASLQVFKNGYEIHYVPQLLVHHRVNVSARKKDKDYQLRRRRSLRAGWFNYFLFYPHTVWPRKFTSSIWQQLKNHTFKGNFKATLALLQAIFDILIHLSAIVKNRTPFTKEEYTEFCKLPEAKIYWKPENEF